MFQSLFYWNLLSYGELFGKLEGTKFGFNPCFTGTSSHTPCIFWKWAGLTNSFNPCFTGTSSHTWLWFEMRGRVEPVSILVLLEPPLIPARLCVARLWLIVSILVLLEPPLIPCPSCWLVSPVWVSILVLLEPPLILSINLWRPFFRSVSILVLLEPPLIQADLSRKLNTLCVSILVLLEPPLIPAFIASISVRSICFNPCFTGTSSHTRLACVQRPLVILFQSLFYWNLLSYFRAILIPYGGSVFQSLFYWNLLSYKKF